MTVFDTKDGEGREGLGLLHYGIYTKYSYQL